MTKCAANLDPLFDHLFELLCIVLVLSSSLLTIHAENVHKILRTMFLRSRVVPLSACCVASYTLAVHTTQSPITV